MVSQKRGHKRSKKGGIDLPAFSFLMKCFLSLVDKSRVFFGLRFFDWLWRWMVAKGSLKMGSREGLRGFL